MIETVGSRSEQLKVVAAVLFVLGGAVVFQLLSEQILALRLLAPLFGVLVALGLIWTTELGKRVFAFSQESVAEVKKVVWPTRKEASQMTAIVFGFVVIMALYLFVVDKALEWLVYDVLMGIKF